MIPRTPSWHSADSERFRKFIRNGLMHDAETRNRWIVERTIPKHSIIEKRASGGYVINRTKFHKAVKSTFEDWIADLRGGDGTLREKMRLRMDEIITMHYSI